MFNVLISLARLFIPAHGHSFYKFWWSQKIDMLKDNEIKSVKLWKAAGRPQSGHIFELHIKDKSAYKLKIKENTKLETQSYTNA